MFKKKDLAIALRWHSQFLRLVWRKAEVAEAIS